MNKSNRYIGVVIVGLFVAFGLLCFMGGYLFSNLLAKKKQASFAAQLCEREERFVDVCTKVIDNTRLSLVVLEGISRRWKEALESRTALQSGLSDYLKTAKESLQLLEINNEMIEMGIKDVSKLSRQYQDAYAALMEMYGVYRQLYSMGLAPEGDLGAFEEKVTMLKKQFSGLQEKLVDYMPVLKEKIKPLAPAQGAAVSDEAAQTAPDAPALKVNLKPVAGKPVFIEETAGTEASGVPAPAAPPVAEQVSADIDQKIKDLLRRDMSFVAVERALGMPLNKFKDPQKREVWVYPSSKPKVRNYIYFSDLKVSSWKKITFK